MSFVVRLGSMVCVLCFALVLAACGKKKPTVLPSALCLKAHAHILHIVAKEAKAAKLQADLPHATKIQKQESDRLEEQWKRLRSKQGTRKALVHCTNETKEPSKNKVSNTSKKPQGTANPKKTAPQKASESPETRRKRVRCVLAALDLRSIRQCYEPNTDLSAYTKPLPFEAFSVPASTTKKLRPLRAPSSRPVASSPSIKSPASLPVSSKSSPTQRLSP